MRRLFAVVLLLTTTLTFSTAFTATFAHEHGVAVAKKTDPIVTFNTNTLKYHCPSCSAARRCTKNCVDIKKSEAVRRGGVACKLCGGTCD